MQLKYSIMFVHMQYVIKSDLNVITSSNIHNAHHAQMLLCTAFLILSIVLFVAYHVDLGLGKQST